MLSSIQLNICFDNDDVMMMIIIIVKKKKMMMMMTVEDEWQTILVTRLKNTIPNGTNTTWRFSPESYEKLGLSFI